MVDNCYWVEEFGSYEICTGASIPELPIGWVVFDTDPLPTVASRVSYNISASYPNTDHPCSVQAAYGNGLVVMACNYNQGVTGNEGGTGSRESYAVHVSADDGFTYAINEPYAWQAGGPFYGGYDAYPWDGGNREHWGTKITFDGTNFIIVNGSAMNISDATVYVVTTHSTDGVNWTTNKIDVANQAIVDSDSMPGKLWYLGTDEPEANYGTADGDYSVGFSDDLGASWTNYIIPDTGGNWGGQPWDEHSQISANQNGCHISIFSYYDNTDYGVRYFRPTSDTTYAAPIFLFDHNLGSPSYIIYGAGRMLASRFNPNIVLVGNPCEITSNGQVAIRRSTDGGVNFGAEQYAFIMSAAAFQYWDTAETRNCFEFVELDDGRIAIVGMINDSGTDSIFYVISEDGGATFGPLTLVVDNGWISDQYFYGGRIKVAARGPDIIVSVCSRELEGKSYMFRPPYL